MGTRSRIARQNADGTFTSIYVHWDGYPSGVGAVLAKHYTKPATVAALMALGDCSSLAAKVAPPKGATHSYESPIKGVTVAYKRDRAETGTESADSKTLKDLAALTKECGGEYLYAFIDCKWYVAEGGMSAFGMPASKEPGELQLLNEALASHAKD